VSRFVDVAAELKTEEMPAVTDADAADPEQVPAEQEPSSDRHSENDSFVASTHDPFAQEDIEEQQPVSQDEIDPQTVQRLSNGASNAQQLLSAPPNNNANSNPQNLAGAYAGAGQGAGGNSTPNPSGGGGSTGGGTANLHLPSQTQMQQMTAGSGAAINSANASFTSATAAMPAFSLPPPPTGDNYALSRFANTVAEMHANNAHAFATSSRALQPPALSQVEHVNSSALSRTISPSLPALPMSQPTWAGNADGKGSNGVLSPAGSTMSSPLVMSPSMEGSSNNMSSGRSGASSGGGTYSTSSSLDLYGTMDDPGLTDPTDYGPTEVDDVSGDPSVAQEIQADEQALSNDGAADDQQEQQTIASINANLTQQENSNDQSNQASGQTAAQSFWQTLAGDNAAADAAMQAADNAYNQAVLDDANQLAAAEQTAVDQYNAAADASDQQYNSSVDDANNAYNTTKANDDATYLASTSSADTTYQNTIQADD